MLSLRDDLHHTHTQTSLKVPFIPTSCSVIAKEPNLTVACRTPTLRHGSLLSNCPEASTTMRRATCENTLLPAFAIATALQQVAGPDSEKKQAWHVPLCQQLVSEGAQLLGRMRRLQNVFRETPADKQTN